MLYKINPQNNNSLERSLSEFLDRNCDVISHVLTCLFITGLSFMILGLPMGCETSLVNTVWEKLNGVPCQLQRFYTES